LLRGQGGLGDPIETGVPGLTHFPPRANQVTGAGVPKRRAETVAKLARAVASGGLRRALCWPDAFYTQDRVLLARAEAWRPWRAYAARHLVARRGSTALDLG
jgi:3-methyladenine DNA glycosylase/8-oxoguanine DNA glycosylase